MLGLNKARKAAKDSQQYKLKNRCHAVKIERQKTQRILGKDVERKAVDIIRARKDTHGVSPVKRVAL